MAIPADQQRSGTSAVQNAAAPPPARKSGQVSSAAEPARDALGRVLRDLRISVIDNCNFRCPYCMPEATFPDDHAFLRARERLDFAEIERVARVFAALGVNKFRLTGGEPLLRKNLPELVALLAVIDGVDDIAMTTNGVLLPRLAQALREAGLTRINISMDSVDAAVFKRLTGGRGDLAAVEAGIVAAAQAGLAPIKINCVLMRGVNDAGALDMVERFRGTGHVLRFIEYMDVGTVNGWRNERVVPGGEMRGRIHARWPLEAVPRKPGAPAKYWRFVDGGGQIGFINSVTEPFCRGCVRARLAADGKLYTCLFANTGDDLRELLRTGITDDALRSHVAALWGRRKDRYSERRVELRAEGTPEHVEMYRMGG